MSNRRVADSTLDGWDGPFFTTETALLHERLASFYGNIESHELCKFASKIDGYKHRSAQQPASDGYLGWWTFTFEVVGGGLVAIRFPRFDDKAMEDGTSTDRHVAHYTMGRVNDAAGRLVVGLFANELTKHPWYGKVTPPEAIAA